MGKTGRILARFAQPTVGVALVAAALLIAGLAKYPTGSFLSNIIRPSSQSDQSAPVIIAPKPKPKPRPANQPDKPKLPKLALSFDDGPNPLTTPLILNALEKNHVKASFFEVGSRVKGNEKILRRMYRDGDDIGNHSWSHPDFINLNEKQIISQVIRTEKAIAAAGVPAPFMFRPPYGDLGKAFPKEFPLAVVLWNVDPRDWDDHNTTSLAQRILNEARPGGIIDMHGIYIATAKAVAVAIPKLKKKYTLVTVSELLNIKPGTTGIYYGYKN